MVVELVEAVIQIIQSGEIGQEKFRIQIQLLYNMTFIICKNLSHQDSTDGNNCEIRQRMMTIKMSIWK